MYTENFCGGDETNRLFGRPRRRWKDDIKMGHVEIGWVIH